MRSLVLSALAVVAMSGCNSGMPRLWRIAIDSTPLSNITDSGCYVDKQLPTNRQLVNEVNFRDESEWVIWDGDTGTDGKTKQYLDIGTKQIRLAEAPVIDVSALIEGNATDKEFTGQRNEVRQSLTARANESRQTQITIKWNDYGMSPTGTVRLDARFACAAGADPCPARPPADGANCAAQLNFVGRRIDTTATTIYGNTGK